MDWKDKIELIKIQKYEKDINTVTGLREVAFALREDNVPLEKLCELFHLPKGVLYYIVQQKSYFNVREIYGAVLISLAPEGRRIQKYLENKIVQDLYEKRKEDNEI